MNEIDAELNRLLAEQQLQSQGGGAFSNSTFINCEFNINSQKKREPRQYYNGGDDDPCAFCLEMYSHNYGQDSKCASCQHYIQTEESIKREKKERENMPNIMEDFEWALVPFEMIGKMLIGIAKSLVVTSSQTKQIAYNRESIEKIDYIDAEVVESETSMTQEEIDAQIKAIKAIQEKSNNEELNEFSKKFQEELLRRTA